jgi:hypothetical protein
MKKIKITTDRTWVGGKKAEKGQTYEVTAEEADILVANGFGEEITKAAPKRARDAKGKLKADDPSTPDVNEAWEGGKAPKKRGRPKNNV